MAQQIKKLDVDGMKKLRDLEEELGCCIVALERTPSPAKLSKKEVDQLQSAEKDMDAVLIAYSC